MSEMHPELQTWATQADIMARAGDPLGEEIAAIVADRTREPARKLHFIPRLFGLTWAVRQSGAYLSLEPGDRERYRREVTDLYVMRRYGPDDRQGESGPVDLSELAVVLYQ